MPFEIGLDWGCKIFHPDEKLRQKQFLIFEPELFAAQKALSDLSGADVKCHQNDPQILVTQLRFWLSEIGFKQLPGPHDLWLKYQWFDTDLRNEFLRRGFQPHQIDQLPIPEFLDYLDSWMNSVAAAEKT